MEQAVLLMASLSFFILGLSYLFCAKDWNKWLEKIGKQGKQASLKFGGINLFIGSFIIAFHPVWQGMTIILTIIGLIALLKSIVYLLFPKWLPTKLQHIHRSEKPILQVSGAIFAIIAILLFNEWYIQKSVTVNKIYYYDHKHIIEEMEN